MASDDTAQNTAQTASQQKELEAQIVSLREQLEALKEGGAWEVAHIHQYQHALKSPGSRGYLLPSSQECDWNKVTRDPAAFADLLQSKGFMIIHNCPLANGELFLSKYGDRLKARATGIAQDDDAVYDDARKQFPAPKPEKLTETAPPKKNTLQHSEWEANHQEYMGKLAGYTKDMALLKEMLTELNATPVLDFIQKALRTLKGGKNYVEVLSKLILSEIGCKFQGPHYDYDWVGPHTLAPFSALFGLHGSATHVVFWFPCDGDGNNDLYHRVLFPLAANDVIIYDGSTVHGGGEYTSLNFRLFGYFATKQCPPLDLLLFKEYVSDRMIDGMKVTEFAKG